MPLKTVDMLEAHCDICAYSDVFYTRTDLTATDRFKKSGWYEYSDWFNKDGKQATVILCPSCAREAIRYYLDAQKEVKSIVTGIGYDKLTDKAEDAPPPSDVSGSEEFNPEAAVEEVPTMIRNTGSTSGGIICGDHADKRSAWLKRITSLALLDAVGTYVNNTAITDKEFRNLIRKVALEENMKKCT